MTVSKSVFIGAVAFVPAAILHGCGGDDKNSGATAANQESGVRNGGSVDPQKMLQNVQTKLNENLDSMVEIKQLVKDKKYSDAWTKLKKDFPQMAKKLVKENFSKGEGKTVENLTTDEQSKCVQKLLGEEAPEPLASTAGASSKDTSAPEGGDDSEELEEDRKDALKLQLVEAIDATNYAEATVVLNELEMTEDDLSKQNPELFEKLQAIKPEEDDEQVVDADPEDMSKKYDSLLKEFAAEKKKPVQDLTEDELEEFADILEEHDMDFTEHVNGLEENEQTKKIRATLKEIAQMEGEDSYHKIVNRIQKKYLADKDEEDLTEDDYAEIVHMLEDHQVDFQEHLSKRRESDPIAKADKVRQAFNEMADGKQLKDADSDEYDAFAKDLYEHEENFGGALKAAAKRNEDFENIDMEKLFTKHQKHQDVDDENEGPGGNVEQNDVVEQAETASVSSKSAAPKTGSRNGLHQQTLDAGSD